MGIQSLRSCSVHSIGVEYPVQVCLPESAGRRQEMLAQFALGRMS